MTAPAITFQALTTSGEKLDAAFAKAKDADKNKTLKEKNANLAELNKEIKTVADNLITYGAGKTEPETTKITAITTTCDDARKFASLIKVGDVRDALENALTEWIANNIESKTIRAIVAVVVLIFQILCFFAIVLIYMSNSLQNWIPDKIRTTSIWKTLNKTPLFVLSLLILFSTPFLYLSEWASKLIDYIILALGIVLFVYSLLMSRECRRYMLLVAGVLLSVFSLTRMGLVGLETITRTGIFSLICNWVFLIVILLSVFDYYLFATDCRHQTALGDIAATAASTAGAMPVVAAAAAAATAATPMLVAGNTYEF